MADLEGAAHPRRVRDLAIVGPKLVRTACWMMTTGPGGEQVRAAGRREADDAALDQDADQPAMTNAAGTGDDERIFEQARIGA